jgi:hypothetical protein
MTSPHASAYIGHLHVITNVTTFLIVHGTYSLVWRCSVILNMYWSSSLQRRWRDDMSSPAISLAEMWQRDRGQQRDFDSGETIDGTRYISRTSQYCLAFVRHSTIRMIFDTTFERVNAFLPLNKGGESCWADCAGGQLATQVLVKWTA